MSSDGGWASGDGRTGACQHPPAAGACAARPYRMAVAWCTTRDDAEVMRALSGNWHPIFISQCGSCVHLLKILKSPADSGLITSVKKFQLELPTLKCHQHPPKLFPSDLSAIDYKEWRAVIRG